MNHQEVKLVDDGSRNMCLATLVLTGILTEEQLINLIESGELLPNTWQGIVKFIKELK